MISLSDTQKIGMGLTGFGVFFLFFGMILFFDKALLAIGNVLFVAGLSFVIGLERTFRFFFQKHKMKATGFFLGGVLIVLIGWPLIGMILEIYGFFLLFSHLLLSEEVKNGAFPQASLYTNPQDPAVWLCNRKLPWLSLVSEVHNFLKPKEYQINLCTFGFFRAVCCEDGHFCVS
ncbi:vesicle transport protein GOT1B isoform X1 [Harpia harpyja]|uniref:vesicle transport protein GOT1B isoform X1 n=1 Tax=Harpia harpyja TaxID=202280 RepID=UPI0022B126FF|nr:vesicle transport protein GOT1B isoform X1 [Harpia harpyja]